MADEYDFYEGQALDPTTRASYIGVVTQKNRAKMPNGQYYVNLQEQVFAPYAQKFENLVNDWVRSIGAAPNPQDYLANSDLLYYSSYDPSTFEGWVAKAITSGGYVDGATNTFVPLKTPGDVNKMVSSAWNNGQFEFTDTDPLRYQGFAKGLWQEAEKATYDYNKDFADYSLKVSTTPDPYTALGIPSPELRYNPTTIKGYTDWEKKAVEGFKKQAGASWSKSIEENWVKGLRKAASDKYAEAGISPYHDAIIALEANK